MHARATIINLLLELEGLNPARQLSTLLDAIEQTGMSEEIIIRLLLAAQGPPATVRHHEAA